jgi:CRP/FNR family cyclic AMP-dependent transcriptional regulator
MKARSELVQRLKSFPLFGAVSQDDEAMGMIAEALEEKSFAAGEEILHKNETGDCAYLLLDGEVEIFDYTMDQEPFTRAVLTGEMNAVFGEVALVGPGKRLATVVSRKPSRCALLRREAFQQLGDSRPEIGWALLKEIARILAGHLDKTNQDVLRLFEALVLEVEHKTIWK